MALANKNKVDETFMRLIFWMNIGREHNASKVLL